MKTSPIAVTTTLIKKKHQHLLRSREWVINELPVTSYVENESIKKENKTQSGYRDEVHVVGERGVDVGPTPERRRLFMRVGRHLFSTSSFVVVVC